MEIETLINAILVQNDIRPAFLIQPINYAEYFDKRDKTNNILEDLKAKFPELLQTECNQGIILSKKQYLDETINSARLGEIIGYPSCNDFDYITDHPDEQYTIFELHARETNNLCTIQLLANCCKQENIERDRKIFETMASLANKCIFSNMNIEKIIVLEINTISIKSLINKILKNENLNYKEVFEINNYIWNLGMEKLNTYPFNYTNHIHKGIVLTLLSYCDNTPLSPFYPLQNHKNEYAKVNELTDKWETELLRILDACPNT